MTPQQKSEYVYNIVKDARRWFTHSEYCKMVKTLWTALDSAESTSEGSQNGPAVP